MGLPAAHAAHTRSSAGFNALDRNPVEEGMREGLAAAQQLARERFGGPASRPQRTEGEGPAPLWTR